jgi:hypothetical protein
MTESDAFISTTPWLNRWRVARQAVIAAASWIVTVPLLARLMRWRRRTATTAQNILGPISGLVWGRIGWVGVRRYGFSQGDAFLAGGLAGAVAPTVELTLRRLGWPPGPPAQPNVGGGRPSLISYPFAWFWGFLIGGFVAALGGAVARIGRD